LYCKNYEITVRLVIPNYTISIKHVSETLLTCIIKTLPTRWVERPSTGERFTQQLIVSNVDSFISTI